VFDIALRAITALWVPSGQSSNYPITRTEISNTGSAKPLPALVISLRIVTCVSDSQRDLDNWIYRLLTDRNYKCLTEVHTASITVTTAHIKSSQSSPVVSW
jgi:transcription termination factor NusB